MTTIDVPSDASSMRHPPFSEPGVRAPGPVNGGADELPSIDQFLDELPSILDFVASEPRTEAQAFHSMEPEPALPRHDSDGWAIAGWQSYDWSSMASLGVPSTDGANAAAAIAVLLRMRG